MTSLYGHYFDASRFGVPYDTPDEHVLDMVCRCQMVLYAYLSCLDDGRTEVLEQLRRLTAPPGGVQALFDKPPALAEVRGDVLRDLDKAQFHIDARTEASVRRGDFLAVQYVREVFRLTDLELFCLTLELLPAYDARLERPLAFLRRGSERGAGADLAVRLYHFAEGAAGLPGYHRICSELSEKAALAFLRAGGGIDPRIADFILQNGEARLDKNIAEVFIPGELGELPLREHRARELADAIGADSAENETLYLCLKGPQGVGRTTCACRTAELLNVPAVLFDCRTAAGARREDFFESLRTAGRETLLVQGMLLLRHLDVLFDEPETVRGVLDLAGRYSGVVFVLTAEDTVTVEPAQGRRWVEMTFAVPQRGESIALWERELECLPLAEPVNAAELANKFTFTPAQIAGTARTAAGMALLAGPLDRRRLTDAAYSQISHRLGEHATLIYARHTWDQLVLGEAEKEMLRNACDQVRYKHVVYDQWGFESRLAYGKGVSMLFAGPPGTGKTMAAQVVANDLGIEMYKVDLSQVVSKYIGETEKNLNQVFNEAKKSNVILFFDETDAILGKRTEVKDAHDKNANLETAYLLQKMEEYDGITVMTTNYKENIDSAFFRRISYVIHFAFPDATARKSIWQGIFPHETPLDDDLDFDYLARQFEIAGGSIKNIAVAAAFMAARDGQAVSMRHIIRAVRYEMAKQGKVMRREDYGEYSYLLK